MCIHSTRVQCYQYQLFQWLFLLQRKKHVENLNQADETNDAQQPQHIGPLTTDRRVKSPVPVVVLVSNQ